MYIGSCYIVELKFNLVLKSVLTKNTNARSLNGRLCIGISNTLQQFFRRIQENPFF